MPNKTIEIEGATLEAARKEVDSYVPEGMQVLSEQVISEGKPRTVRASAATTEEAFAQAKTEIPADAIVLYKRELTPPAHHVMVVEAPHGISAVAQMTARGVNLREVGGIRLIRAGRNGFLGIGRRPDRYEVEMYRQAVVEVILHEPARIAVVIGPIIPARVAVTCDESSGQSVLAAEDAHGNQVDLREITEPALLFIQRDALPYLEANAQLWKRVSNPEGGADGAGKAATLTPGEFRITVVDTYAEATANVRGPAARDVARATEAGPQDTKNSGEPKEG